MALIDSEHPAIVADAMNWKTFFVRLVEALRWPIAFIIAIYILREGLSNVLDRVGYVHL